MEKVVRNDTIVANYSYLADDTKLSVTDTEENGLYYLGSLVYEKHANTIGLESAAFSSGRIVATSGNDTEVRYFLTDHLGSTRVVARVTPTGRIDLDRKDYYPFGKEWAQADMPTSSNRYLFSGKERQYYPDYTDDYYDFGARFYHPDTGGWLQQDALLQFHSPYTYCGNNPIRWRDPSGLWTEIEGGGGYKTSDPNEIRDFLSGNKNDFMGKTAYNYVDNIYKLDKFMEENTGIYTRRKGEYSTVIPLALVIAKNTSGQWQAQNMDEIQDWQSAFARDFGHHLTMSNPIVKGIHRGHKRFLLGSLAVVGGGFELIGTGLTYGGMALSATGLGAEAGLGIMAVGSGFSRIGGLMQIGYDACLGDTTSAIFNSGLMVVGAGASGLKYINGLTTNEQFIIEATTTIPIDVIGITYSN